MISRNILKNICTFYRCETLMNRLRTRTNNNYGKTPEELTKQLEWNKKVVEDSLKKGYIVIDSSKDVSSVVDKILSSLEW